MVLAETCLKATFLIELQKALLQQSFPYQRSKYQLPNILPLTWTTTHLKQFVECRGTPSVLSQNKGVILNRRTPT